MCCSVQINFEIQHKVQLNEKSSGLLEGEEQPNSAHLLYVRGEESNQVHPAANPEKELEQVFAGVRKRKQLKVEYTGASSPCLRPIHP